MHDDGDGWITLTEAARRLNRERSGIFRRARRGDFGQLLELDPDDDGRPTLVLVSAAAVDAELERRQA